MTCLAFISDKSSQFIHGISQVIRRRKAHTLYSLEGGKVLNLDTMKHDRGLRDGPRLLSQ